MKLYRGPWVWSEQPFGCWKAPEGSIGAIDLRTLGGVGSGLFMTDANLPSPYEFLTDKTGEMASVAYDLITTDPDPDGINAHKPLLPNGDKYEVFLGNTKIEQNLIRSGKMWDASCRVIQADVEKIHAQNPMLARKYLGFLERQHGDYSKFIPKRLAGLKSAKPETTYTDDFNRADSSTVGGNWTESDASTWSIASNKLSGSNDTSVSKRWLRYDADLSSADNYSQITVVSTGNGQWGVTTRCTGAHYQTNYLYFGDPTNNYLFSCVAGSFTLLSNLAGNNGTGVWKVSANGSTIKGFQAGTERCSVTNTAVTGNLRGGVYMIGSTCTFDDWTGSDLASASSRKMTLLGCG